MSAWESLRARYAESADPLRTQRRIELVAVLLGLFICLQVVFGLFGVAVFSGPGAIEPAADSLRVPAVIAPGEVAAAERQEITARPLFWVGRRPLDNPGDGPPPEAPAVAGKQLKDVRLVGLFGGGDKAGVIVLVKDKKQRILRGEELEGWTLEAVEAGEAVFTRGGGRELLALKHVAVGAGGGGDNRAAGDGREAAQVVPARPTLSVPARATEAGKPATATTGAADKAADRAAAKAKESGGGSSLSLGPGAGGGLPANKAGK